MITVNIDSQRVNEALTRLSQSVSDLSPLLHGIGTELLSQTETNFEKEGRPNWQPLAAATIRQREKQGNWPGKILQISAGGLAASVIQEVSQYSVSIGSNKAYAAIQQLGGQAGRGKKVTIPARPFLPFVADQSGDAKLQPEAEEAILDLVMDYFHQAAFS